FDNQIPDSEFTNRVKERLVFLALDSDGEKYLEIENDFKAKFKDWKIKKCSKISLKYPADESKIVKEDNRNFILPDEKTIYYLGHWVEQRNYPLVQWLKENILNIAKPLQFLQDVLLNKPSDIIDDFENKGRAVPDEIKQRFKIPQPTQQETKTPEATQTEATKVNPETKETTEEPRENPFKDITPDDEKYIREIITGVRELNEKLDANTTAKIKTLLKIKDLYQGEEISDEEYYLKVGELKIIVRSAQNGLLFLD